MKTRTVPADVIWSSSTEMLTKEECLPVIGSCQVSSILSTLDASADQSNNPNILNEQSPNLIVIENHDFKVPQISSNPNNLQSNYMILKENGVNKSEKVKTNDKLKNKDNFKDMLYFVCNLCPFLCTKNVKITEHLENAHKNKTVIKLPQLKCPACPNVFYHKMPLRSHLIHDHGVGNSDLSEIIQAVVYYATNKNKLVENQKKVTPIKPQPIDKSTRNGPEKNLTSNQSNKNLEPVQFEAVFLPQVDISPNNAEKIINSMMNPNQNSNEKSITKKMHKCVVAPCKIKLHSSDNMNYHIRSHFENDFKCLECSESFSFWKPLTSHLWRSHKINMELYSCDKCDYKSVSLSKLNNIHKLIHSDVKAFVCNICKKAFKNSKQLGNHKICHKKDRKKNVFVCEICYKQYADRRQLKIHLDVVHKKIKPFLCSYCGYKGSSRSSLKMHIRQHTGEKPFTCDSCSYATSDHNSLRRHKLRHTGQKPYKCSYCSYACIQSSTYKVHLKTKHPGLEKDLMFTCQECQFRSVKKDMYIAHLINVHNKKPQIVNN